MGKQKNVAVAAMYVSGERKRDVKREDAAVDSESLEHRLERCTTIKEALGNCKRLEF